MRRWQRSPRPPRPVAGRAPGRSGLIGLIGLTCRMAVHLALLVALPAVQAQPAASAPAPGQALEQALNESVVRVPSGGFTEPELELTLFRPAGDGPFPVVLINHGRAPGPASLQPRYRPLLAAREFVRRGYLVAVPMRQGFSQSGGAEISGACNVHSNGLQQARSVRRTLGWLASQPFADVARNAVLGQSHGGLTTLAYGTEPHAGTRLLVNFAGGLRQEGCLGWENNLIRAIADYGGATRLPSLWFYGDNDSFFAPTIWRPAFERYQQAGGRAELVAFGSFGNDAHAMFGARAGLRVWLGPVLSAFTAAGLPVAVVNPLPEPADLPTPPASNFARLDEVDKVPLRFERAREGYRGWLAADGPKAFAVHPMLGSWGASWGGNRANARALANCDRSAGERAAGQPCKLYAVDDTVVWAPE